MTDAVESKAKILFVDDEPRILVALKALFRSRYQVFTANSGADAVALMESEDLDVIVSDQRMPEMTGVEVLRTARERRPRAIRVLLTGYSDLSAILGAINDGEIFRFINKPWSNNELRDTIAAAVAASQVDVSEEISVQLGGEEAAAESPASVAASSSGGEGLAPSAEAAEVSAEPPLAEGGGEVAAAADKAVVDIATGPKAAGRETGILVLDEDSTTREVLQRVLHVDRPVFTAVDLDGALELLETESIGVIITELSIGGESVTQLLTALRQHHPSLVAIVLTSQADAGLGIELINRGQIYRFLSKPISEGMLRGSVNLAVRRFDILQKNPEQTLRLAAEEAPEPAEDRRGVFKRIGRLFGLTA